MSRVSPKDLAGISAGLMGASLSPQVAGRHQPRGDLPSDKTRGVRRAARRQLAEIDPPWVAPVGDVEDPTQPVSMRKGDRAPIRQDPQGIPDQRRDPLVCVVRAEVVSVDEAIRTRPGPLDASFSQRVGHAHDGVTFGWFQRQGLSGERPAALAS